MFKTVITLLRGQAAAAEEGLADRNALLLLDQQMRDAQASLAKAQHALAIALAEQAQEGQRMTALADRIASLETRARAALAADRKDLATEAAEAIAALEADQQTGRQAHAAFAAEIARLRGLVGNVEQRVAALQQGRRVARVAEAVRLARRRIEPADSAVSTLADAETTLARLRARQSTVLAAEDALDGLTAATRPETVETRLADAGFGPATRPTAADVLARLSKP